MKELDPILSGPWPFQEFPESVQIRGKTFRKAVWYQHYTGVVAQYRETVPHNSLHLKVYHAQKGYFYAIDHTDDYNPDMGLAVEHFQKDIPDDLKPIVIAKWLVQHGGGPKGVFDSLVKYLKKQMKV